MIDLKSEVLKANRAFYEIFRLGDYPRMDTIWSRQDDVSVHHPGWSGVDGRENVMASWYQLMVLAEPPPVYPSQETVILNGSKAVVFCVEEEMGNGEFSGSNIFVREGDDWRLLHHQAVELPPR